MDYSERRYTNAVEDIVESVVVERGLVDVEVGHVDIIVVVRTTLATAAVAAQTAAQAAATTSQEERCHHQSLHSTPQHTLIITHLEPPCGCPLETTVFLELDHRLNA